MARDNSFDPHSGVSRDRRRRLTAGLLRQADRAEDPDQRASLINQVIVLNISVARSIASRYRRRDVPVEDLEQVANAALVRSAQQFDVSRQRDFLAYAVPSIRGELRRYFRDHGWTVRPPRRVQELQSLVVEKREQLRAKDRGNPTDADIAEALDVPEDDVSEALRAEGCFTPTSLDSPVGEQGTTALGDLIADPDSARGQEAAEARVMLRPVLRRLKVRDRKLLRLRFRDGMTQQEIADEFGVTQTQVSRLLGRVLRDLRRTLGEVDGSEQRRP
ncbi:sigma-70 family RNA polymerase sigma factor [Nocardioides limicola]|uniref:sigma-70 family RNA polymerase sigma factor n=1 Tax=Nocardioides limicola TaxID=2803368 RepID=UPI00193BCEDB|nr:sigma-70 family RNA polymerase sigma factor [Nocardioides sp. DJM-14]